MFPVRTAITVHSPSFPQSYPPLLTCEWTVETEEGQEVEVVLSSVQLEENYDYLLVCNGLHCEPRNILTQITG